MAGELDEELRRPILQRIRDGLLAVRASWLGRITVAVVPAAIALALSVNAVDGSWKVRWFPLVLTTWDALVGSYVVLTVWMFLGAGEDGPKHAAAEGGWASRGDWVRVLTVAVFAVITGALILLGWRESEQQSTWTLTAAIIAVIASWLAIHTFHAEYYAHKYYKGLPERGCDGELFLTFPDDKGQLRSHHYLDFCYFALAIGSTFGTTDVQIYSKVVRKAVLLHALISFWFNVAIIAVVFALATGGSSATGGH